MYLNNKSNVATLPPKSHPATHTDGNHDREDNPLSTPGGSSRGTRRVGFCTRPKHNDFQASTAQRQARWDDYRRAQHKQKLESKRQQNRPPALDHSASPTTSTDSSMTANTTRIDGGSPICILYSNVRSVNSHKKLQNLQEALAKHPDVNVLALCETRLTRNLWIQGWNIQ